MGTTCTLPTPFGWEVEYTPEAVSLAQGTMLLLLTELSETANWTDAGNTRHDGLTLADMKLIGAVFAAHINSIQDMADSLRKRISCATTEELPAILTEMREGC